MKSTVVLVVVLGGLLVLYFVADKDPAAFRESKKLVPGFQSDKATAIRVENAKRNEKLAFAKKGDEWEMREPVESPADATTIKFLLDYFANYDGTHLGRVGEARANPTELGLASPRATVEIEGATPQPLKVKVGSDDLKQQDLFLQIGDEVFRAPRTIYNTLAKGRDDFRDRRAFTLPSYDLTSIDIAREGAPATVLAKEGPDWKLSAPFHGRVDVGLARTLASALSSLRISRFEGEAPTSLEPFGLTNPTLTITLRAGDKAQKLRVGKTDGELTAVQREGSTAVWSVAESDLGSARKRAEDFRDANVFGSFPHDNVKSLAWKTPGGEIAFEYDSVARKPKLAKPRAAEADRDAYEAALKALDGLKAKEIVAADLAAQGVDAAASWIELMLKDAAKAQRVSVGKTDGDATFLHREGDDYVLKVDATALAFLTKPQAAFVSKELLAVDSYVPGRVELDVRVDGAETRPEAVPPGAEPKKVVFEKDDSGKWVRAGGSDEAKDFSGVSDSIWHAKAEEILDADPKQGPLAKPEIELRVYRRAYGDPKPEDREKDRLATLRLARDASGAWLANGITGKESEGGFAARVAPELAEKIRALAFPPVASQPAASRP
ncbi:MAG TPA: DUF4340 domain-containing protein [Planctomycetota bacterium]|nr:DUF4340 domain-containing protein [Planctomycetota bacterium]